MYMKLNNRKNESVAYKSRQSMLSSGEGILVTGMVLGALGPANFLMFDLVLLRRVHLYVKIQRAVHTRFTQLTACML